MNLQGKLPFFGKYVDKYSKVLTREEELVLLTSYFKNKDKASREKLLNANYRFLIQEAIRYSHGYHRYTYDLVQEGSCGLIKALDKFDLTRAYKFSNFRFISYAKFWMRAYMLEYLYKNRHIVNLNRDRNTAKYYPRIIKELKKDYFDIESTARSLGVKPENVIEIANFLTLKQCGIEEVHHSNNPTEEIEEKNNQEYVKNRLLSFSQGLSDREQDILFNRLYIRDESKEKLTLNVIGRKYNVTKQACAITESKLKAKLKQFLTQEGIQ